MTVTITSWPLAGASTLELLSGATLLRPLLIHKSHLNWDQADYLMGMGASQHH